MPLEQFTELDTCWDQLLMVEKNVQIYWKSKKVYTRIKYLKIWVYEIENMGVWDWKHSCVRMNTWVYEIESMDVWDVKNS